MGWAFFIELVVLELVVEEGRGYGGGKDAAMAEVVTEAAGGGGGW